MRSLSAEDEAAFAPSPSATDSMRRGDRTLERAALAGSSTRCSPARSSRSPSAPPTAAAWSPGSTRRRPPTDASPPSCTAWPRNCVPPSPQRPRQRRRTPQLSRQRHPQLSRQRHPSKRGAATSRPTKPPATWPSAPPACRSWPAPARSGVRLTATGPSPSARSRACRASATAARSGSPSHRHAHRTGAVEPGALPAHAAHPVRAVRSVMRPWRSVNGAW